MSNSSGTRIVGQVYGDLTGSVFSPTVVGLHGRILDANSPAENQTFIWDPAQSKYVLRTISNVGVTIYTSGNLTGSSASELDPILLKDNISLSTVTASYFTGTFIGNGSAISSLQPSNITNFSSSVRGLFTGSENITVQDGVISANFSSPISSLTASNGISSSFYGDGGNLTGILTSSISNFSSSVRSLFSAIGSVTYNSVTGEFSGSGGGGGGLSTVYTSGSITGSGQLGNEVRLKDIINVTTVSASYLSGNGLNISGLTSSNITDISSYLTVDSANNTYATLSGLSGTFVSQSQLSNYAKLSAVSGTFVSQSQLSVYALSSDVSSSFSTPSQVTSALAPYLTNAVASSSYASLVGVSSSFSTPSQVSSALTPYLTTVDASGTFLKISDLTSSARSAFTAGTNITISAGQISLINNPSIVSGNFTGETHFQDIYVLGTASIGLINFVSSSELQIGDKFIVISSGSNTQGELDNSGIKWGSGSVGETIDRDVHAYVMYDYMSGSAVIDRISIYPGVYSDTVTASYFSGSYYGNGENLNNITASSIPNFTTDLRSKLSGSGSVSYNPSTGVINGTGIYTVYTSGSITGSGTSAADPVKLKNDISVTTVTASYYTGSYTGEACGIYGIPYDIAGEVSGAIVSGRTVLSFMAPRIFTMTSFISSSGGLSASVQVYLTGVAVTSYPKVVQTGQTVQVRTIAAGTSSYFTIVGKLGV